MWWLLICVGFGIIVGLLVYFTTPKSAFMPPEGMTQGEKDEYFYTRQMIELNRNTKGGMW